MLPLGLAEEDAVWPPPEWGEVPPPEAPIAAAPLVEEEPYPPPHWEMPEPTGAFGLEDINAEPDAKARATLDRIGGQYGLAPMGQESVDASSAFAEEFGGQADLADERLETGGPELVSRIESGLEPLRGPLEMPRAPESDGPLDPMSESEEARFTVNRGPEYAAVQKTVNETERVEKERTAALAAERANSQTQARNLAAWEKRRTEIAAKQDRLDRDLVELGEKGIDNNHWMESRTGGQTIAAYIAAIAGGITAAKNGGRNTGLEMIKGAIDQDIETQKANLAHQRGVLGDRAGLVDRLAARYNDDFQAAEIARAASYEGAQRMIKLKAADYDPRGTAVQNLVETYQGLEIEKQKARASAKEALEKKEQQEFENDLKVSDKLAKEEEIAIKWAELREKQATRRAAATEKAPATRMDPDTFVAAFRRPNMTQEEVTELRPPWAMTMPEYKEWVETGIKHADRKRTSAIGRTATAEAGIKESEATSGAGGELNTIGDARGEPYRNKGGKAFVVADPKRRERIDQLNTAAQNIRRMSDYVSIIRDEEGGTSSAIGSKAAQEYASLAAQVDFETYVAFGLGAPSAGDTAMAKAARGGKELDSFIYKADVGLDAYAKGIEQKLNTEMRNAGYNGEKVVMPRVHRAEALERTKEDLSRSITDPIPPHARGDAAKRQEYIDNAAEDAEVLIKRKKPSETELREWGKTIAGKVDAGALTKAEAMRLVVPMAAHADAVKREEDLDLGNWMRRPTVAPLGEPDLLRPDLGDPEALYERFIGSQLKESE